jgi:benzoylformate decarboxylase
VGADVHGDAVAFRHAVAGAEAEGLFLLQLGDLTDYGPNSPEVLRLMFGVLDAGRGQFILGNHDHKLRRALVGQRVRMASEGLGRTLEQLGDSPDGEALAAAGTGTGIQGSLRLGLPTLTALVPQTGRAPPPPRAKPSVPPASSPISAEYLFHTLSRLLPREAIVVEEAPSHRPALQTHLPIRDWGGFYTMTSGGLGYSLPAAVGIALAHPGRRIAAIIGDGSMMYSIQALWTAAQQALPLTVVVVNNSGYGAMRSFSRVMGTEGVPGIDLPGLDFVALAHGMGCPGMRVADPALLADALVTALRQEGPMLVEVAVDAAIPTLYHKA